MVNVGIAVVNITVVVGFSDSDVGSAVVDRTVEGFWSIVDSTVEGCLLDDSVVGEFSVVGAVDSNNDLNVSFINVTFRLPWRHSDGWSPFSLKQNWASGSFGSGFCKTYTHPTKDHRLEKFLQFKHKTRDLTCLASIFTCQLRIVLFKIIQYVYWVIVPFHTATRMSKHRLRLNITLPLQLNWLFHVNINDKCKCKVVHTENSPTELWVKTERGKWQKNVGVVSW